MNFQYQTKKSPEQAYYQTKMSPVLKVLSNEAKKLYEESLTPNKALGYSSSSVIRYNRRSIANNLSIILG